MFSWLLFGAGRINLRLNTSIWLSRNLNFVRKVRCFLPDTDLLNLRSQVDYGPPLIRQICLQISTNILVLQRKPFAFGLLFCLANFWSRFFTFNSKTRSIVPTSNLCRNVQRPNQLNQQFSASALVIWKEQTKIHQYTQQINVDIL